MAKQKTPPPVGSGVWKFLRMTQNPTATRRNSSSVSKDSRAFNWPFTPILISELATLVNANLASFADAEAVNFHSNQFTSVEHLVWICGQKAGEPVHQLRNAFRTVMWLDSNNPVILAGRIGDDIGKVAIQGNEYSP